MIDLMTFGNNNRIDKRVKEWPLVIDINSSLHNNLIINSHATQYSTMKDFVSLSNDSKIRETRLPPKKLQGIKDPLLLLDKR